MNIIDGALKFRYEDVLQWMRHIFQILARTHKDASWHLAYFLLSCLDDNFIFCFTYSLSLSFSFFLCFYRDMPVREAMTPKDKIFMLPVSEKLSYKVKQSSSISNKSLE